MTRLGSLVLILLLASCVSYTLVPPARTNVTGGYSVASTVAWNKRTLSGEERWTRDGDTLQEVIFVSADSGKKLLASMLGDPPNFNQALIRETPKTMPLYDKAMSPLDVKELIESSLTLAGLSNLETGDFRPAKFGTSDGFRFEFTGARREGLKQQGFAVGRQTANSLQLVIFLAAATYYYDRDVPEAARIVASIQ